ncbi:hypothetical protein Q5H92_14820 [Hymenobacter sp. M29]|uniref:Uncharacterized protein n=1 Tax=Hymenobacter mellowenesis TaxID=3063995 RepID=A0ABT9AE36_9BACT|nr:hypothetical protein [Hymenobacter sp. M29]MDO7847639.1 hypothetical protein [Hymenobacter sp. M29]
MPYSTVTPAPLSVNEGEAGPGTLTFQATTNPPRPGSSALVVFPFVLSSSNTLTPLPVVGTGGLNLDYTIPQDGVLVFRAVQVAAEEGVAGEFGDLGEIRWDLDNGMFYQVTEADNGQGSSTWVSTDLDYSTLLPQAGSKAYALSTDTLTSIYHRLLLLTLQKELGPLPANNQPKVDQLTESLGKLDRGLQGATYLFQDTNYTECARTLELLSLTRYLP